MGKFQKMTNVTEYQQRDSQLPFSEDYSAKQEKGWGLNDGNNLHPPNQVSLRPYWNMCESAEAMQLQPRSQFRNTNEITFLHRAASVSSARNKT